MLVSEASPFLDDSSSSWQCKSMETDIGIHRLFGSSDRIQAHVVVKSCSTEVSDGWVLL
jgi:hypothetical protein